MSDALPPPLVSTDCNCQGLPFMPLEVGRLLNSDLMALSTGDEFKAAVVLWAQSWWLIPAGSLPDDDRILARLASYNLADWRGLREMALKNWVKCSDGRLYHPVIVDLAVTASKKRRGQSERANTRWAMEKARQTAGAMPRHGAQDAMASETVSHGIATVMQGTGKEREPPLPPFGGADEKFDEALAAYPQAGRAHTHPEKARAEWTLACDAESPDRLTKGIRAFAASDAATAESGKRVPSFHRWLREKRYQVWLTPRQAPIQSAIPVEVRSAVIAATSEPWAASYLLPCAWQDVPRKALLTKSPTAAKKLEAEAGAVLAKLGVDIVLEQERAA